MQKELTVFYDGLCPLCSREIDHYKVKDEQKKISFVDISKAEFDAKREGLDPSTVHKVFHVKNQAGKILTGVDGFVAIWDTLNVFRPLSVLAKIKLTRIFFDLGYIAFAKIRPLLPKRQCDEGVCQL